MSELWKFVSLENRAKNILILKLMFITWRGFHKVISVTNECKAWELAAFFCRS